MEILAVIVFHLTCVMPIPGEMSHASYILTKQNTQTNILIREFNCAITKTAEHRCRTCTLH